MSADASPSRRRLWVFRLLAALVLPLGLVLLAEGALRLAGVGHETAFLESLGRRDSVERVATNATFGWRFFPPTIARRPLPLDFAVPKPDGTYRVVVLGGSAAMGIPDPAFGVGPVLGAMLDEAWPDRRVEVGVAAMTAINSHVVLPIAQDIDRLDADAVVVYLGNNEVVGPWGAGTVLQRRAAPRSMIRLGLWLRSWRLGQLVDGALSGAAAGGDAPTGWRGMALFTEQRLRHDDPRLELVYENFRDNLDAIVGASRRSGARVIVSTVAVDLADTPPFATASAASGDGAATETAWRQLIAGDDASVLAAADRALAADPDHADWRFLRGRALLAAGRTDEARRELERARDLDTLRFRADSRIQQIIRDVVAERAATDDAVVLVDAAESLAAASPDGVPGREHFWEHVHLTFAGTVELATAILGGLAPEVEPPTADELARRLAYTPWDDQRLAAEIESMMARPPFTNQLAHDLRASARRAARHEQKTTSTGAEAVAAAEAAHRRAVEALGVGDRPQDVVRRTAWIALLRATDQLDRAAAELAALTERLPRSPGLWTDFGNVSRALGRFDDAEAAYARLEALDGKTPEGPFNRGLLAIEQGRFEAATAHFDEAMARDPGHLQAHLGAARALDQLGRGDDAEAMLERAAERASEDPRPLAELAARRVARGDDTGAVEAYRAAIERRADRPRLFYNLGVVLGRLGRDDEAAAAYGSALRLDATLVQARDNLVELYNRRGAEAAQRGDLAVAIDAFRRGVAVDPDDPGSRFNLALALGMAGRVDDAVVELRAARDLALAAGRDDLARDASQRLHALGR